MTLRTDKQNDIFSVHLCSQWLPNLTNKIILSVSISVLNDPPDLTSKIILSMAIFSVTPRADHHDHIITVHLCAQWPSELTITITLSMAISPFSVLSDHQSWPPQLYFQCPSSPLSVFSDPQSWPVQLYYQCPSLFSVTLKADQHNFSGFILQAHKVNVVDGGQSNMHGEFIILDSDTKLVCVSWNEWVVFLLYNPPPSTLHLLSCFTRPQRLEISIYLLEWAWKRVE